MAGNGSLVQEGFDLKSSNLWTVQFTSGSIGAGGTVVLGITTGPDFVLYMTRSYTSTSSNILIELFEETYSGGVTVNSANRNLAYTSQVGNPVASMASAVTRGGGGVLRASVLFLAPPGLLGAGALGSDSDSEWYILKPSTQYVLVLHNDDIAAGIINFRYTYKKAKL